MIFSKYVGKGSIESRKSNPPKSKKVLRRNKKVHPARDNRDLMTGSFQERRMFGISDVTRTLGITVNFKLIENNYVFVLFFCICIEAITK